MTSIAPQFFASFLDLSVTIIDHGLKPGRRFAIMTIETFYDIISHRGILTRGDGIYRKWVSVFT